MSGTIPGGREVTGSLYVVECKPPAVRLVGQRGVGKPVSHHHAALGKPRHYHHVHIRGPCREKQHELADHRSFETPVKQHVPNPLGHRCSPGFPGCLHRKACGGERRAERLASAGLPCALHPLEGDEHALHKGRVERALYPTPRPSGRTSLCNPRSSSCTGHRSTGQEAT